MRRFLSFLLLNCHTALLAVVNTFAIRLLVLDYAHSLYFLATINARNFDVGAHCLMLFNFFPNAFCLAVPIGRALNRGKFAVAIMSSNLLVLKNLSAPHAMIPTLELHFLQFLLNVFLHTKELWFDTLHGTHACFVVELFQALMMVPILARLALDRVNQDGLAKGAEEFWLQLVLSQQV